MGHANDVNCSEDDCPLKCGAWTPSYVATALTRLVRIVPNARSRRLISALACSTSWSSVRASASPGSVVAPVGEIEGRSQPVNDGNGWEHQLDSAQRTVSEPAARRNPQVPVPLAPLQALLVTQEARLERLDGLVDRAQLPDRPPVSLFLDRTSNLDALLFEALRSVEDSARVRAETVEVEGVGERERGDLVDVFAEFDRVGCASEALGQPIIRRDSRDPLLYRRSAQ